MAALYSLDFNCPDRTLSFGGFVSLIFSFALKFALPPCPLSVFFLSFYFCPNFYTVLTFVNNCMFLIVLSFLSQMADKSDLTSSSSRYLFNNASQSNVGDPPSVTSENADLLLLVLITALFLHHGTLLYFSS